MIGLMKGIPVRLRQSIVCSALRKSPTVNVQFRRNITKQNSKNVQEALKLNPQKSCPPPPPQKPQNDMTKWAVIGALVAGGIGGVAYYLSTKDSEEPAPKIEVTNQKCKINRDIRSPATNIDIPKHVPYLLIGGGTASFAAFRAIKSNDAKAKILVISDEAFMPYMRPPLSKEIWFDTELGVEQSRFKQWNGAERSLFYEPEDFYLGVEKLAEAPNGGVSVIRGYTVDKLNVAEQKVVLDDGTEITYEKCLLATGSTPKSLDIFDHSPANIKDKIFSFKSIKDFENLKGRIEKSKNVAIIGSGFLGSELACALAHYGQQGRLSVFQLFHESGNMGKVLPNYLSKWTTDRIRDVGVNVMPDTQVKNVEAYEGNQLKIVLNDGKTLIVDHIIQAVGTDPNIKLAEAAGLEVDSKFGGFVVNAELQARTNLYVAGDVACFHDPKLGRRRVEHHDHAVVSGRLAGENMVGLKKPYKHQSMFWSDLGPTVGYEAIGLVDSSLRTVAVFAKGDLTNERKELNSESDSDKKEDAVVKPVTPVSSALDPTADNYGKGVVFYMQKDKIVGILLWNVFNRINIARKILSCDEPFEDLNEVAKLFDIFEQN
ncbi:unnamed protein product [Diamesa tonsa]